MELDDVVDPNHDAMLESMRRQARSSSVLKRHDDLRKQCEKEMSYYDKAKRLTAHQCRRSQIQHLNRMKTLLHCAAPRLTDKRHSQTPLYDVTDRRHSQVPVPDSHSVTDKRYSRVAFHDLQDLERRHIKAPLYDVNVADPRHSMTSFYDITGGVSRTRRYGKRGTGSTPSSTGSYKSESYFTGRERFLFRVFWQNGKQVYIRDEAEAQKSRQLLNGISCDGIIRVTPFQRTQSVRL